MTVKNLNEVGCWTKLGPPKALVSHLVETERDVRESSWLAAVYPERFEWQL